MATKTTAAATSHFTHDADWVGGVAPANNEPVVVAAGHTLVYDYDNSGWAAGTDGIKLGENSVLQFDTTKRTYLKVKNYIEPADSEDDSPRLLIGTEEIPVAALGDGNPATTTINIVGAYSIYNLNTLAYGEVRDLYDSVYSNAATGTATVVLTNGLTLRTGDTIVIECSATKGKNTTTYTVSTYTALTKTITLTSNLTKDVVAGDKVVITSASILIRNNAKTTNSIGIENYLDATDITVLEGVKLYYHHFAIQSDDRMYLDCTGCIIDGCNEGLYGTFFKYRDGVIYNTVCDTDYCAAYPLATVNGYSHIRPLFDNTVFIHNTYGFFESSAVDAIDCLFINNSYPGLYARNLLIKGCEFHANSCCFEHVWNSFIKDMTIEHAGSYGFYACQSNLIDGFDMTNATPTYPFIYCSDIYVKDGVGMLAASVTEMTAFNSKMTFDNCDIAIANNSDCVGNNIWPDDLTINPCAMLINNSADGYNASVVGTSKSGNRNIIEVPEGYTYSMEMYAQPNNLWSNWYNRPTFYQYPIILSPNETVRVSCSVKKPRDFDTKDVCLQIVDAVFDPLLYPAHSNYSALAETSTTPGATDWEVITVNYKNSTSNYKNYYLRLYCSSTIDVNTPIYFNWRIRKHVSGRVEDSGLILQ